MLAHRYLEAIGSAAMLAIKRLAGIVPEVNLRECVTYMPPPSENKTAHSGFETQRQHHQKSKTEISVAPQQRLVSSKNFFLKESAFNTCFTRICYASVNKLEAWSCYINGNLQIITHSKRVNLKPSPWCSIEVCATNLLAVVICIEGSKGRHFWWAPQGQNFL